MNRPAAPLQLGLAIVLSIGGLLLLYLGLCEPPRGRIDSSVLIAFGEVATFAGALIGIDYRYRIGPPHDKQQQ